MTEHEAPSGRASGDTEAPREDERPTHRPAAPNAPIPGRHWYASCNPDHPPVGPDGICEDCGGVACPGCGFEVWDGACGC